MDHPGQVSRPGERCSCRSPYASESGAKVAIAATCKRDITAAKAVRSGARPSSTATPAISQPQVRHEAAAGRKRPHTNALAILKGGPAVAFKLVFMKGPHHPQLITLNKALITLNLRLIAA